MSGFPHAPGLDAAVAAMHALRERQAARRQQYRHPPETPPSAPLVPRERPSRWGQPGPERVNRPIQVGGAVRIWWNWD